MEMDGDGDGYDFFSQAVGSSAAGFNFGSQASASGGPYHSLGGLHGVDLNFQAPVGAEEFPHLADYENFLQGGSQPHGDLQGGPSGFPPHRPLRTLGVRTQHVRGQGGAVSAPGAGRGRQGHVPAGGSFSGAIVDLGASSAGGSGGRLQYGMPASRASGRRRPRTRARSVGAAPPIPQQGLGADFINPAPDVEDQNITDNYSAFGGQAVSTLRANWSDENNATLLRLCVEQLKAGHYIDGQMTGQGYKNIVARFLAETGLVYTRRQFRHQIGALRSTYSFWKFLQKHIGLGRKHDGSIDAESEFWQTSTKVVAYLFRICP